MEQYHKFLCDNKKKRKKQIKMKMKKQYLLFV